MLGHIIITGAGGFLGGLLADYLLEQKYEVSVITSDIQKIANKYSGVYENSKLSESVFRKIKGDILIHCAFARRDKGEEQIANSLKYTGDVFRLAVQAEIPAIINISSQGVYGATKELRTEDTVPAPTMPYTMAKYASELLLESACFGRETCRTNIRLDSIAENQNITRTFVEQAMKRNCINITGGKQVFSFMSGYDFPQAIASFIKIDPSKWENVYNLGWNDKRYLIIELAEAVAEAAKRHIEKRIDIKVEPKDYVLFSGMDSSRFINLTGWHPKYNMVDIFDRMIQNYKCKDKEIQG